MAANSSMSRDTTGASSRETIIRSPNSRNELKVETFNGSTYERQRLPFCRKTLAFQTSRTSRSPATLNYYWFGLLSRLTSMSVPATQISRLRISTRSIATS